MHHDISFSCKYPTQLHHANIDDLVEWVGSSTPVCKEQAEADSLEQAGNDTYSNHVQGSVFSDNGSNNL